MIRREKETWLEHVRRWRNKDKGFKRRTNLYIVHQVLNAANTAFLSVVNACLSLVFGVTCASSGRFPKKPTVGGSVALEI